MSCYICMTMTMTGETSELHRANENETLGSIQSIELLKKIPAFYTTRN
jgi:hypothetical protein